LIIIGASRIKKDLMLGLCKHAGFDKKNIDIYKDYNKLKHFDTTNLLKIMSKYEGIIIGPMPHSMKNCFVVGTVKFFV